jgi:hypothetical protein
MKNPIETDCICHILLRFITAVLDREIVKLATIKP